MLQTNKIAALKAVGLKGVCIHTLIITVVQVSGMSMFGIKGMSAGLICGVVHFFIDYLKLITNKYFENKQFIYFMFDQIMHIFLIFLLTVMFTTEVPLLNPSIYVIKLSIIIIIITYVSSVSVKILLRDINNEIRKSIFFYKNERIIDELISLILWGSLFFSLYFSIIFNMIILYIYQRCQRRCYKYDYKSIIIKYAFIMIVNSSLYLWLRM